MSAVPSPLAGTGIGLRQPHYREVFERRPALAFLEVHSENFFLDGGASMHALERARAAYPISLHGVGLSLGSADRLADEHLAKLKRLVDRVDRVQSALKRQLLVENLSAYVECRDSEMTETAFLAELARRTGCGLLLDLNNLYVNAVNFGFDPVGRLGELDGDSIGQIHLAGHSVVDDCLVDTHGARVCDPVWSLHAEACRRFGARPTLIEWDTDLPALDVLLQQAAQASAVADREAAHA